VAEEFDLIVIGGGPAGEHAVGRATDAGLATLLIESELVGGECSYWACMPSKTLLRPTQVLEITRRVPGAREAIKGGVDASAALARRDWMVSDWEDAGQVRWVENTGAKFMRGRARLFGERVVEVEAVDGSTTRYTARRAVIIAVGSEQVFPPIAGLRETHVWTNREATASHSVPSSLAVLGGGPVGVELAQAWKRLGAREVSIVEAADRLVASSEPFASDALADSLRSEGIALHLSRKASRIERPTTGKVTIGLDDGSSISATDLLIATGRRPRTEALNLETFGLSPKGPVPVDTRLCVSSVPGDWLYAIGDANGIAALTHMGKYQARIAVRSILGEDVEDRADRDAISSVVFTDPQIASVGLTEEAARVTGRRIRTTRADFGAVAATPIIGDRTRGAAQLVIDEADERVVGATFVGSDVADWLHAATVAIIGRVPLGDLRHAVAAYPTMSEIWLDLVESYFAP
jgi:pyruvate/2-oxoglutarate dehydrogenase complex dihydrolipoamide dehydrogenase (E3) component